MAKRPAWSVRNGIVIAEYFEFKWNGGFAISQKQKNIQALHEAILVQNHEKSLEISSKGLNPLGKNIGAFSLKLNGVYIENIFQAAKKYELGGPFTDLLIATPRDAKRDERHHTCGNLISFVKDGVEWPLEPKTSFYDYIYVIALIENYGQKLDISEFEWFTDIEFNSQKSINCQARSVAIYKLLQNQNLFDVVKDRGQWLQFHSSYVKG